MCRLETIYIHNTAPTPPFLLYRLGRHPTKPCQHHDRIKSKDRSQSVLNWPSRKVSVPHDGLSQWFCWLRYSKSAKRKRWVHMCMTLSCRTYSSLSVPLPLSAQKSSIESNAVTGRQRRIPDAKQLSVANSIATDKSVRQRGIIHALFWLKRP